MTTSKPINKADCEMLAAASSAAFGLLPKVQSESAPRAKICAVQDHLDHLFSTGERCPLGEDAQMAFGALFGSTICDAFGWDWVIVSHGEWEGLGVVDNEQRYLILPLAFMDEIFSTKGVSDRSPKLIFNFINDERLPESAPRRFVLLT